MSIKNKNTADFRTWYFFNIAIGKKDFARTITGVMGWTEDIFTNKLSGRTALTKPELSVLFNEFEIDRTRFFLIEVDSII